MYVLLYVHATSTYLFIILLSIVVFNDTSHFLSAAGRYTGGPRLKTERCMSKHCVAYCYYLSSSYKTRMWCRPTAGILKSYCYKLFLVKVCLNVENHANKRTFLIYIDIQQFSIRFIL